jgi:flagellar hook-associated protein 2
MSVSSSSSSGLNLSSLLNSLGSSPSSSSSAPPVQITGLASGLNTNQIISELMAIQEQPLTHLQNNEAGIKALNSNLGSIQTALQGLVTSAQALSSAQLFSDTQTVTSSNSNAVTATTASGVGAVVGGYQVAVTQMASAAQGTWTVNASALASGDTVTINPSTSGVAGTASNYKLSAGATPQDLVDQINSDQNGSVWATLVNGNIVFSDRTTGSNASFSVADTANALTAPSGGVTAGQNASYSINGGSAQSSQSNTVTNAIPGVTLTFTGLTNSATGPVEVNVPAPTISQSAITSAVQSFVSSYNSVISQIQGQLSQAPSSSDPTQGTLYDDPGLSDLLNQMRQAMYQGGTDSSGNPLPAGLASMMDLGVTTGATTGAATPSQSAISGQLTLDTTTLASAIQSNPSGVTQVLSSFVQNFTNIVNNVAQASGVIDSRVLGNDSEITNLDSQIATMQSALNDKQSQLTQQFAALEGALSQNQSTASWLTSQIAALPVA